MKLDPIRDPRWPAFLAGHPLASVFHSPGWLLALQRTYRYEPLAFTTSAPGQSLRNGIVFCQVNSWITGTRLVSLPFSDHCQPLIEDPDDAAALYEEIAGEAGGERHGRVELRPRLLNGSGPDAPMSLGTPPVAPFEEGSHGQRLSDRGPFRQDKSPRSTKSPLTALTVATSLLTQSEEYYFHKLDLRPDLDTLYANFHKSCIQRKIRRAEREGLGYEAGRSEPILAKFYQLLLVTRRRHGLPPQPMAWFRNLIDCLGESLTIRVASKGSQPIGSILTLRYKNTLVYKYGCSHAQFHNLGAMPLLFWKAIQEAKEQGATELDLGRSDMDNAGLAAFKEHFGAVRSKLTCFRLAKDHPEKLSIETRLTAAGLPRAGPGTRIVRTAIARLPDSVMRMTGGLLYRHMG